MGASETQNSEGRGILCGNLGTRLIVRLKWAYSYIHNVSSTTVSGFMLSVALSIHLMPYTSTSNHSTCVYLVSQARPNQSMLGLVGSGLQDYVYLHPHQVSLSTVANLYLDQRPTLYLDHVLIVDITMSAHILHRIAYSVI